MPFYFIRKESKEDPTFVFALARRNLLTEFIAQPGILSGRSTSFQYLNLILISNTKTYFRKIGKTCTFIYKVFTNIPSHNTEINEAVLCFVILVSLLIVDVTLINGFNNDKNFQFYLQLVGCYFIVTIILSRVPF